MSGSKSGAFEEGTNDGEPEKSEDQLIRKSLKELIELIADIRASGDGSVLDLPPFISRLL